MCVALRFDSGTTKETRLEIGVLRWAMMMSVCGGKGVNQLNIFVEFNKKVN